MAKTNARISRVGNSWRVRVFGYPSKFFADSRHGGEKAALAAAREWRDARWDGKKRDVKLTPAQRRAVAKSKGDYRAVAEKYGIAPNYVHQLRREHGSV